MTMIPTLAADSGPAMHATDAELDKIQHTPWCRLRILVGLIVLLAGMPTKAALLTFQDIPIPGSTESEPFFSYTSAGFSLTAANPQTGFPSGFQAYGPNSIFFAGATGVVAFPPPAGADNVIRLTQDNGRPFSLLSIELSRNFSFDPIPTVTFTGTRAGGTTVAESFTITIPPGTAAFQSFAFTGFSNLQSVTWGQPILAAGIHQFTNIELLAPVPEPSARLLIATGFGMLLIARRRLAARSSRAISFSQNGPTPDNRNWSFS